LTVAACDPDPIGPLSARQMRDPSGALAKPVNSTTVQVGWTDSAPNEVGFRIERSATGAGGWALAGTTGPDVTFNDGGRTSEQQVCYRVFAVLRNALSNPSNTSCTTPPAAPTGLTATMVDQQAIDLAWADNSAVEHGYQIERATAEAGPYAPVAFVAANTTSYRQSGLTTNTTYWYRVLANNDGGFSDASNIAHATPAFTVPAAPSSLSASPEGGIVFVSWVDNASNEDGFRVERSLDLGGNWATAVNLGYRNATSTYDYNRALEQQVCYRVIAYNAQGSSVPSNMDCTAPPAAPTNLRAIPVDQSAIDLAWEDNSSVEDGYVVWRYDGVTASSIVARLPENSTSYRDASMMVDHQYWYYVVAAKDSGGSYASNVATAIVATAPPLAPSDTRVTPFYSTAISVDWTDRSSNEQGFRIERSLNGGATWDSAGISNDASGFLDGDRTPDVEVCYHVIAFNARGDSDPSAQECTAPPLAPTDLAATPIDPQTVDLAWTDNSSIEAGYVVGYFYFDDYNWIWVFQDVADLPANATSYRLTWLASDTYYVAATKDGGQSDYAGVSVVPGSAPAAAAPFTGSRLRPMGRSGKPTRSPR
jgi:hypothetical protein